MRKYQDVCRRACCSYCLDADGKPKCMRRREGDECHWDEARLRELKAQLGKYDKPKRRKNEK
jgi:hypothetical protein